MWGWCCYPSVRPGSVGNTRLSSDLIASEDVTGPFCHIPYNVLTPSWSITSADINFCRVPSNKWIASFIKWVLGLLVRDLLCQKIVGERCLWLESRSIHPCVTGTVAASDRLRIQTKFYYVNFPRSCRSSLKLVNNIDYYRWGEIGNTLPILRQPLGRLHTLSMSVSYTRKC